MKLTRLLWWVLCLGGPTAIVLLAMALRDRGSFAAAQQTQPTVLQVGKAVDLTPGLARSDQRWPAVAAGKDLYLVVWQEGEALLGPQDANIYALRVAADGTPLDPKPIAVCTAKHHQTYPAVCYDGTHFLVAWQDFRSSKDWDVYLARVTPDGKVLDPDGTGIAVAPGNQIYPALASNGSQTLLVWSDLRPRQDVPEAYGLRGMILASGQALHGQEHELVPAYDARTKHLLSYLTPQVCWDGVSFVIAAQRAPAGWQYAGPSLFRVSPTGKAEPIPGGFLGESMSLASNPEGKNFLVWSCQQMEHGHGAVAYLASLFTPGKGQTNCMPVGLQGAFGPRNGLWCAAAYNGKHYIAVVEQTHIHTEQPGNRWLINVDLVATRISPETGEFLDIGCLAVPANAWQDMRPFRKNAEKVTDKQGIRVAGDPSVSERHPAVASLGNGQALLVYSYRAGIEKFKIFGLLLTDQVASK